MMLYTCEICDHVFAERHRVIPGENGGIYAKSNIVWLCPNHHAAVHHVFNLETYQRDQTIDQWDARYCFYMQDDKDFARYCENIAGPLYSLAKTLNAYGCKSISDIPRSVGQPHIHEIIRTLRRWKINHGKGHYYYASEQVSKNNQLFGQRISTKADHIGLAAHSAADLARQIKAQYSAGDIATLVAELVSIPY